MNNIEKAMLDAERKDAIKNMMNVFEAMVDYYAVSAKFRKAYYDELTKAGFNDNQATTIIGLGEFIPGSNCCGKQD